MQVNDKPQKPKPVIGLSSRDRLNATETLYILSSCHSQTIMENKINTNYNITIQSQSIAYEIFLFYLVFPSCLSTTYIDIK